ncbi:hypothetical protein [Komagataeibacter xylinus]|uniref:hypothetical protein n=1 Tax=Komagataeibacter xylinus TaxID=28448 RepID=UPI00280B10D4|nr:hypothetical protein [Komagataeibacter xylinus]
MSVRGAMYQGGERCGEAGSFGRIRTQRNFAMGAAAEAAPHILIVDPLNDADAPQLIAALAKKGGSGIMPLS